MSLLYNGSVYRSAIGNPQVCHCVITTSDCDSPARLKFRVIDLRLHSYNDIASCEPQSLVMLQDTATSQSLRCQPNYFQKGFRDVFYSSSPYARMSLYNQPGVYPTQVWLEVTGKWIKPFQHVQRTGARGCLSLMGVPIIHTELFVRL